MPTKKIAPLPTTPDTDTVPCYDLEHKPPSMMVYEAGIWEHTCPSCGKTVRFTVNSGGIL